MTDARAFDPNRLPWLTEPPAPSRKAGLPAPFLMATLAALLVAGLSYWFGQRVNGDAASEFAEPRREVTVPVPPPTPADRAQDVTKLPPATVVEPAAPPPVEALDPAPRTEEPVANRPAPPRKIAAPPRATPKPTATVAAPARETVATKEPAKLVPRSPWYSNAAEGQMVRVGTFSSRTQARKGWSRLARVYPAVKRLPTVIAPAWSGKSRQYFYRLQIGTTSQAHSAVLCQRMRIIGQSCVVLGAPTVQRGMPQ